MQDVYDQRTFRQMDVQFGEGRGFFLRYEINKEA